MKLTGNKSMGSEEMKLLDFILPPLADGKYELFVSQEIKVADVSEEFHKSSKFIVSGRAFTMTTDSIFTVYPVDNAVGNFSNELPFIVSNIKTLPWQYHMGGDLVRPWVALIVIGPEDITDEKDITVSQLLEKGNNGELYYPWHKQPDNYTEKDDDLCHVVDLPVNVYRQLIPKPEETPYLCHGKYVNLSKADEDVSCKDGFFSVVMGNRFIPSKEGDAVKSTVHLVSLLGYDDAELSKYKTVRLCSLYRWNVFSQSSTEPGFGTVIRNMNCAEFGCKHETNELKRRGVVAKEHRFRTGETSASLYGSPLVPAKAPVLDVSRRHTADGHLIYKKDKGLFDVRYACAFQLGRMISLSNEAMALKILNWRRGLIETDYNRRLRDEIFCSKHGYEDLLKKIGPVLKGEEDKI